MKKTKINKETNETWEFFPDKEGDLVTLKDEVGGFGVPFEQLEEFYIWCKTQKILIENEKKS